MSDILDKITKSEDSPLQSLVWMAEDSNVALPPIPEQYLERLIEVVPVTCFATDETLVQSLGRGALGDQLAANQWPKTGMALRLVALGRSVYWQYLLVGRVHLIQVNLRFPLNLEMDDAASVMATEANMRLNRFLSNESTLVRYLSEGPRGQEELGHLTIFENLAGGKPMETHYTWNEERGLLETENAEPIFISKAIIAKSGDEVVFYA